MKMEEITGTGELRWEPTRVNELIRIAPWTWVMGWKIEAVQDLEAHHILRA